MTIPCQEKWIEHFKERLENGLAIYRTALIILIQVKLRLNSFLFVKGAVREAHDFAGHQVQWTVYVCTIYK
jgi:hypothetical protein